MSAVDWPADSVERRPLTDLLPYISNPRVHPDWQIAQIARSIEEWGWTIPILVDEAGNVIAGHGRIMAALKLNLPDAPCMVAKGWSEEKKRAYVIADNQLALNATWDTEMLAAEIKDLQAFTDLGLLGFKESDLAALLRHGGDVEAEEATPPLPTAPITQTGDVWRLGAHRLLCGDATSAEDVQRLLQGAEPVLMVTDPPYGVDYDPEWRADAGMNNSRDKMGDMPNDDRVDWSDAWRLFAGDVAYIWHASWHISEVQRSLEATGFEIRTLLIWAKDRFSISRGHYHWQHEPCWYAVRKNQTGHWAGDRSQTTLWTIPARDDHGHGHSTQKPVECMRRPMQNNSKHGEIVYDPFMGSGTSLIAAETIGRICYGIEINPAYVDVAVQRWETFTGLKAEREPHHG